MFDSWEEFLARRSEEDVTAKCPASEWSIRDVIAHLRAWQQVSIARLEAALLDREPQFPSWLGGADPFFAEDHADEFNARIYEIHRQRSWSSVYQSWREGFLRFLELAEAIPETMLSETERFPWLRGYALSAVLHGSYEHHQEHLAQLSAEPGTASR